MESIQEMTRETMPERPKYKYSVWRDDDPMDPREWGGPDLMFCKHPRLRLGDEGASNPVEDIEVFLLQDDSGEPYYLEGDIDGDDYQALSYSYVLAMLVEHAERVMDEVKELNSNRALLEDLARANAKSTIKQRKRTDIALCLPIYLYDHSGITISHQPFGCPWDSGQVGWHYITKASLEKEFGGDEQRAEKYMAAQLKAYDDYLRGDVWGFTIEDEEGGLVDSCGGFYGDQADIHMLERVEPEHRERIKQAWEGRF